MKLCDKIELYDRAHRGQDLGLHKGPGIHFVYVMWTLKFCQTFQGFMEKVEQNILYQNILENQRYGQIYANVKEEE